MSRVFPNDSEGGLAVLITVIALSILSLIALYVSLNATTEVRISDNYESEIQAGFAARAGISHARELLKGLDFSDLLTGPDGTFDNTAAYLARARTFPFRNPLEWRVARSLDIGDPGNDLSGLPDDGLVNTGSHGGANGSPLIPLAGIAATAPNPYGAGSLITSRYFVKVTDNNGEASELAKDAADNPFVDGDGIVIVRSMGIAPTITETAGANVWRNSIAAAEARFRQSTTFRLDAPLVVQGDSVDPSAAGFFDGSSFHINGGAGNPGIGAIDTNTANGLHPAHILTSALAAGQTNNVLGQGLSPSILDITGMAAADTEKALLLNPAYVYNFVNVVFPEFADNICATDQDWPQDGVPDIGSYDIAKPPQDPTQHPKVTIVRGDLSVSGNVSGAGILVVTGRLAGTGHLRFNGLVLVIGAGEIDMSGMNLDINGGLYVVNVSQNNGAAAFGTPRFTASGNSRLVFHGEAIQAAIQMIPPVQLGWREIRNGIDP